MFTEDLDFFLADFGVSVSFTDSRPGLKGVVDAPGMLVLQRDGRGAVEAVGRSVLLPSADVADLRNGDAITVGGTAYVVREKEPVEDGALTLVWLRG